MRLAGSQVVLSASDLMRFQGCAHATRLDLQYLRTGAPKPIEDPEDAQLLQSLGEAHEQAYLQSLLSAGRKVAAIDKDQGGFARQREHTLAAMHDGPDYIYQAALARGAWAGYADFLERVEKPSKLGGYSYEVIDTKLKRSADPKHLLQLCLYADLLADAQGVRPDKVHVILGDNQRISLRLADFDAYVRRLGERLQVFVDQPTATQPEPVEACGFCRWRDHCDSEWDSTDSTCLVAGISRSQRRKLAAAGITTVAGLAGLKEPVPKLAETTLEKLRAQAKLQHARRQGGDPSFELKPGEPGKGLARLPEPNPGDIFFDMEGYPLVENGLEYLFGILRHEDGGARFEPVWAHDAAAEREAVANVLRLFETQLKAHPRAHIYHYAQYEVTALKRLASRYGVGEAILDQLLREQRFVDLYRVVQQGLFASEPGYSIKNLEVFYLRQPRAGVTNAADSVVAYERWRVSQDPEILESIRAYNETDCESTRGLRDWLLRDVRPGDMPWYAPAASDDAGQSDKAADPWETERTNLRAKLAPQAAVLGTEVSELLFELTFFHRREGKPQWWAMFDRAEREPEELIDDLESLGGLTAIAPAESVKRSRVRAYRFPEQETKLRDGALVRTRDKLLNVEIVELDPEQRTARVRFGPKAGEPPAALDLIPGGPVPTEVLAEAVRRVVDDIAAGRRSYPAIDDLVHRRAPRLKGCKAGAPIVDDQQDIVTQTINAISRLDASCLPIQGPPGAGKTYVSSKAILHLMQSGQRVAVASNSHKAIDNLLKAVAERAREAGTPIKGIKKVSGDASTQIDPWIESTSSNDDRRLSSYALVGGTAWLFARPEQNQKFDYLFVDEAGQVSLANLLAMATAARNLVLVGDPMQLAQPIQGDHPGETGTSALGYLLQDQAVVHSDRGIFLPTTWRMHPAICRYISDTVYEGRLKSEPETERQRLVLAEGTTTLAQAGICFIDVPHEGNSQSSREEAAALATAYHALLQAEFVDRAGVKRRMQVADILVVAPYNAQANMLLQALPAGARVGTVDRFQGQEAPTCLISMTTSSGDELPRDIEFLFSRNRLNVAVSRAQALAVAFCSPRLLDVSCHTIDQMKLVNALCSLRAHAGIRRETPGPAGRR